MALALACLGGMSSVVAAAQDASPLRVEDGSEYVVASTPNYTLRIQKEGFRYQIQRPDGRPFAAAHPCSGLQLAKAGERPSAAETTELLGSTHNSIQLRTTTVDGVPALVTVELSEDNLRFSVRPEREGSYDIVLRTAGLSPAFGLADHGTFGAVDPTQSATDPRISTDVTGYRSDTVRSGDAMAGNIRMNSNFVIFPRQEIAFVNVEPRTKIIRVTEDEAAQGSSGVREMPALYYFVGAPKIIYKSFLDARNRSGYPVYEPKYDFFGVGWEAFGALAWETNQKTVTENVERYLELGFPLRWMVVGSGFWPRHDENLHATTSFGMWDPKLYPDPRGLIDRFRSRGLRFIIGLRIGFIPEGPFTPNGLEKGYFIEEDGLPKTYRIAFPRQPVYLLDTSNPAAVRWYADLAGKWLAYGIDGFKEDLFGYGNYTLPDDLVDPVNRALMDRGVMVMGRNAYLGSPVDLHRYNDFNYDQNQDRGPINGLLYAYSGFPYVYPDIVGGKFAAAKASPEELRSSDRIKRYVMRYAQYAAVNPSMSMGYGPWNFADERVSRVTLDAARLHDRLHPYIYSAAIDAYRTGFPYTMTPLPLAYPDDPDVYELENTSRRGYQWLIGESLLATPLYGDDYATAETRDVYLPEGEWIDYDTGQRYEGGRTLENFALPVEKTPLFVGGKGIVVEQRDGVLEAHVYPIQTRTSMRFRHADGGESGIVLNVDSWSDPVRVETAAGRPVMSRREGGKLIFLIASGTDYLVQPDG